MDLTTAITSDDLPALLHEHPELVTATDEHGVSALLLALYHRRPDARDALLEAGANPNVAQQGGYTPLHSATHNGDAELAKLLLDHGADPDAKDESGQAPREALAALLSP